VKTAAPSDYLSFADQLRERERQKKDRLEREREREGGREREIETERTGKKVMC